ncbi:MAG TPA: arylsulfatase [Candidatus Hydrogenedentes bacterium]|nr:arylsulfatase [Candidatus Hydrogenedentota bacterium]HQE82236.1 arylsulfatase [Candidatus Hydrogenedentota bacterium]HQH52950.1 arylsulfatase [Candidatus Hydrogenedentota bacterium]HQM50422.1 arylsulfatase [Candidatus Hydrogenedentota bacterium]
MDTDTRRRFVFAFRPALVCALAVFAGAFFAVAATAQGAPADQKPNILVIFGDDIGLFNISAYNMGMMGSRTPNIDRIAHEGAIFTDYYGQQSCTAGRAAFITGQHPFRTGLLKVGLPGAALGLQPQDPTIADLLKNQGYVTGQFGKNHLGDRNEFLPTVHGFDEFFGNLYHLNAEEEPEDPQYPKDPAFKQRFGPRGALKTKATDVDDTTVDPRFGKVGRQTIEDTGPITRKRMETVDEEFLAGTLDFMERAVKEKKPFFIWHNSTRMHVWTRLQPKYQDKTGYGLYADGMNELDDHVGILLKKIDDLGIADNTIVIFTTDNGAEKFSWPDGGATPFRGEKGSTWEGGMRVPCVVRWPGVVKPGTVINDIVSHEDWAVTLAAAAGEPDVKEKLLQGYTANGKPFKVHLDGYDQRALLAGTGPSARNEIFYFDDNGNLNAVRVRDWKAHFALSGDWLSGGPVLPQSFPKIVNLRMDPLEDHVLFNADNSPMAMRWMADKCWAFVPMQAVVGKFLQTFQEFPQRQKSASFNIDQVVQQLEQGSGAGK